MERWGHFGHPVLIFPTAGGDLQEIERFQLIQALSQLVDGGRIKVYCIDGLVVRAWLSGTQPPEACARLQDAYDSYVYEEVLQRIREDCRDPDIKPILTGASLGAFFAISGLCRHPDAFRVAIGLSGVYDLARKLGGVSGQQSGALTPIEWVSRLTGPRLKQLRQRKIILGSGQGDYETPAESQRLNDALVSKAISCRFSLWGSSHDHTWSTWREMLPGLLAEQL
jgi:esterase/lipase superfamily enzyme